MDVFENCLRLASKQASPMDLTAQFRKAMGSPSDHETFRLHGQKPDFEEFPSFASESVSPLRFYFGREHKAVLVLQHLVQSVAAGCANPVLSQARRQRNRRVNDESPV